MTFLTLTLLSACSDYGLERQLGEPPPAWPEAPFPIEQIPPDPSPQIQVEPSFHDFGVRDPWSTNTQPITISNVGHEALVVSALSYDSATTEMTVDVDEARNGPLPWTIPPGESRVVDVSYVPVDETTDQGALVVTSNDTGQRHARAEQVGSAAFSGFTTGWYIVNDDTPYDLTSNATYRVDYDGDPDAYWYEPSGVNGMTASTDVAADFATLREYVIDRAGAPTPVTGPLSFYAASDLPDMMEGSFSYILCDFWMDPSDDPSRYSISTGRVDDGVRVIVNGQILGELSYGMSGNWALQHAVPGQVNTLVVILMDNAMWEKYVYDLAFYKDGVMVGG